jgi:competence protein ComEC
MASASAFLLWIHLPYAALPDARLTVTSLNVGKGAAHVVSFPGGRHMVVDCGSAARGGAGEKIVAPFLRSKGVRRVDVLVLTRPREDHDGGASSILEEFPVGEIWVPGDASLSAYGEAVARRAGLVRRKYGGEVYVVGGAEVVVRSTGGSGNGSGVNERRLVLEIRPGVQNRNCFNGKNLLPSAKHFLLENGAFTVHPDRDAVYCGQERAPRFWERIWRLP